ncbi:MAG: hypothetical protein A2504_13125 [Bdellovibrionales bacterium RIFOXYD12_FULL_39_22]|nr:MAG: hypothetical protein A2385_00925 [Bdellovibrionales bacterium RIFOXYB1_FULL_39_21]OFZ43647.1 MAG: hypothetical protein A2485_12595 [Bdellovibrionales bacterium RIFOXYC12_FULL_39_17]OFZ44666.1 MAG: hypothetical protein A2404_10285 [Bdellovibrionales bacterium RIFOXYC1_FULL_39_130]OFZ72985.1 MAG: hypothetical protein A2451_10345 [Bdellovibrionales bacterium RIFOXYC2_FULL_39_8]OFZ76425.1 MAG: hypothetical protein A2560_06905 [Bdellovibrionales bacterium RIFOXYD1_FULL_39_84]OFZ94691.1 MAG:
MKISTIIPTFNRGHCLPRAVNSVLKQQIDLSQFDLDLYVIDDGSTDNTSTIISPNEKLSYIKTANKGVSAARNLGIQKSTGEWLAFLDSDDEWLPHKLALQMEVVKKNPTLKIVHGEEFWYRRGVRVNQKNHHQKFGGEIYSKCLPLCLISPSAALIHRTVFEDVGYFDERFLVCEDYDLWLRITNKYQVGFVETAIINKYGGHEDQLSRKFFAMDFWRVLSMHQMLKSGKLADENILPTREEIKRKATILLNGYKKHNNMENYYRIEEIYDSVS